MIHQKYNKKNTLIFIVTDFKFSYVHGNKFE